MRLPGLAVGLLLFGLGSSASLAQPCCGPITPGGKRLEQFLDGSGVEHLWQAGVHIIWDTGEPDPGRPAGRPSSTHCSAFVAAMAKRLNIYVLRPPDHGQTLLANAQMGWLGRDGGRYGWRELRSYVEAQKAANRGELVLEAFENPNPHRPGHIAIVRPSLKTRAMLDAQGPEETQAGDINLLHIDTADGFLHHRGAWVPGGGGAIRYYAHTVRWP
ncbi:MAG TPA: hypothetical protein VL614_30335 [Acetobacteraceae bacterium]|nr:hypothetical protein [Acetobacteraceae bacterium]